jgi:NAD(P) transhydrogenase subunit beta
MSIGNALLSGGGLLAVFCLLVGLWRLASVSTSAYGLRLAGVGLLLAIVVGVLRRFDANAAASPPTTVNLGLAGSALLAGVAVSWWRSRRAPGISHEQRMAWCNGMGAAAVLSVAALELIARAPQGAALFAILAATLLAAIALSGALVTSAKLREGAGYSVRLSGRPALIGASLLAALGAGFFVARAAAAGISAPIPYAGLIGSFAGAGAICGLLITLPVIAADLPIAVSVGNALTGAAVALLGWVLQIPALMIIGMIVAGAGMSLAQSSAKVLRRSIADALFWEAGSGPAAIRPIDAGNAGMFLRYARKVIVVPGYGLAAAQAHHKLAELINLLLAAGVDVKVAVHPSAGRIPGQLDGLLADAGIAPHLNVQPAEGVDSFSGADIALVIGANDVVNPSAAGIKSLPLFGMAVFNVGLAKTLYVIKRGQGPGFAGIANQTFHGENCSMVYGDAQSVLAEMIEAMKRGELAVAA